MTTLDADTQQSLKAALYAYLHEYGGDSQAEVRAIAGALLSVQAQAGELSLPGWEIEQWVDALVAKVDLSQPLLAVWQVTDQHLATQAQQWREQLLIKTRATVDAYLQKYAPADIPALEPLVATVLPLITDAPLTRDTARHLIDTVSGEINASTVSDRVIDATWLALAEQVHQAWQHRETATSVADVMEAYIQKFQPTAVDIGESLVERAVEAVSNSKLRLGLDVDLSPETRQLLIKQVMLQLKLRDMSSPPIKTALEIAQDVHDEVMRYRRDRDHASDWSTVTTDAANDDSSTLGGEMSIGLTRPPSRAVSGNSPSSSSTDG